MKHNTTYTWVTFQDTNSAQDVMEKMEPHAKDISFIAKKDAIGSLTSRRDVLGTLSFKDIGMVHVYGDLWQNTQGYSEPDESVTTYLTDCGIFEKEARACERTLENGGIIFRIETIPENTKQVTSLLNQYQPLHITT